MTGPHRLAVVVGATAALTLGFLLGHTLIVLAAGVAAANLTLWLNQQHLAEDLQDEDA